MRTQFTIFKKGLTLIAVPLLVQAVFIAVLVKAQADHDRAQDWAVHTKEVIAKVEELHRSLVEGYAGVRGLVFSGDPAGAGSVRGRPAAGARAGRRAAGAGLGQRAAGAPDRRARRPDRRLPGLDRRRGPAGPRRRAGPGDGRARPRRPAPRRPAGDHRRDPRRGGGAGPAADGGPPLVLGAAGLDARRRRRGDRGLDADPGPAVPPGDHPAPGRPARQRPPVRRGEAAQPAPRRPRRDHRGRPRLPRHGRQPGPAEAGERDVRLQRLARPALAAGEPPGLQRGAQPVVPRPPRAVPPRRRARAGASPRDAAHGPRHRGVDPLHPGGRGAAGADHRRPAAALPRRPGRVPVAGGRPLGDRRQDRRGAARHHHRQGGPGRRGRAPAGLGRPHGARAGLRQPDRQRRAVPRSGPAG